MNPTKTGDLMAIRTNPIFYALLLAAGILLFLPGFGWAQEGLISGSQDGAIEIEADNGIEWLRDLQQYRAYGNATAKRGTVTVIADTLVAYYREEDDRQVIFRLDAEGNVIIKSDGSEAFGDKAVYHLDKKVAVLVGKDLQVVTDRGTITAEESMEYWEEKRIVVARGNALAIQNERRLKAGVLTAFIEPGEEGQSSRVTRIDATSGVHISTPTDIVTGKEGVYNVPEEKATICGKVKITRGSNQLNGECAVVNMLTGRSTLQGKSAGDKVKGLILQTQ
jgi:lipopolysaccharide export system protein LptA